LIPDFDHNSVIPPKLENPTRPEDLSPFSCTTLELCEKFATSKERVEILFNLLKFRLTLCDLGVENGFQWLDGSFTENVEELQSRPPNDLDLVTFYSEVDLSKQEFVYKELPEFFTPSLAKTNYKLDHYAVDLNINPFDLVEYTRYWIQLFTHNRQGIWKGMLKIRLGTTESDKEALDYLNSIM